MFDEIKLDIEKRMDSSIQSSKSEMGGIRAGRASPSMLDSIKVEAYGQKMNINQLANITTPDARSINVDIWDQANVNLVDKALRESDLGINPMIEGNLIRLPLPQLTEERRIEFLKMARKISENTKIAIRNIRRDGIEKIKKLEKEKEIGQDELKKFQENIEYITSAKINIIDEIQKSKEADLKNI
jgi:ribosome recycling factor